jgi:hypothetical protein
MLKMKLLRNLSALLIIPAVCSSTFSLLKILFDSGIFSTTQYIPFWLGTVFYIVLQIVLYKPIKTYVFGHELSHAIAGILSGAQIKKFKVSETGGSVVLTKDNIWITLAPYFFPIYSIGALTFYIILNCFTDAKLYYGYFLFLMGFTITFHIALTIYVLQVEQPDLKVYGVFFSYSVISAVNVIVFSIIFALTFSDSVSFKDFIIQSCGNVINFYIFIINGVKEICLSFQKTN